jgi:hypothetical protein
MNHGIENPFNNNEGAPGRSEDREQESDHRGVAAGTRDRRRELQRAGGPDPFRLAPAIEPDGIRCRSWRAESFIDTEGRLMLVPDYPWAMLCGLSLASALCGYGLRHLLAVQGDRANAKRISALCDQLDMKDGKLHGLRAELLAAQAQGREIQGALVERPSLGASTDSISLASGLQPIRVMHGTHDDPAARLEDDNGSASFKQRVQSLEGRVPAESALSRRTG